MVLRRVGVAAAAAAAALCVVACGPAGHPPARPQAGSSANAGGEINVQLGPRPYYLVESMNPSPLKDELLACSEGPFEVSEFVIGHRGAPLQFPESTKESFQAAARMGAGVLECDIAFTKDRELVCRHSHCDLHTTTNILTIPELAAKCSQPFTPADPAAGTPASARCCTTDLTLAEFKTLCGKMDEHDPEASDVDAYQRARGGFRTTLYATCGTPLSHAESIELFDRLGTKFAPELKTPDIEMPYQGNYTQAMFIQQAIDEYKAADIDPERVWPQSFNLDDIRYWIEHEPEFAEHAVLLDERMSENPDFRATREDMERLAGLGLNTLAPPIWALLEVAENGEIVASEYARLATAAGLDIVTWTLERSGPLRDGGGWYYQTLSRVIDNDGQIMEVLHVLATKVGIKAIFSDWPATATYYANCMGLE